MTISAVSTAQAPAGIGIVRISGPDAISISTRMFSHPNAIAHEKNDRRALLGVVTDALGEALDECLCLVMRAPRSYTGEDTVEFHCHGGLGVISGVLDRTIELGCRLAEPGEFTRRALLAGRIDLSQAEAINETVRARTKQAAKLAVMLLDGRLGDEIRLVWNGLIKLIAEIDAATDFPDDVVEMSEDGMCSAIASLHERIDRLESAARAGQIYRTGAAVAIAGRPNVGKSSLMNALLGRRRAIVTPVAGTTRDVIEEELDIDGIPVRIVDMAGLRETTDQIEAIGVKMALDVLSSVDITLFVVDGSEGIMADDVAAAIRLTDKTTILVVNKVDLPQQPISDKMSQIIPSLIKSVEVSSAIGTGLDELLQTIKEAIGVDTSSDSLCLASARQLASISCAKRSLMSAWDALSFGYPPDILAMDLREAAEALGSVTGDVVSDDILEVIFRDFCVGK